jgi:lipocalin
VSKEAVREGFTQFLEAALSRIELRAVGSRSRSAVCLAGQPTRELRWLLARSMTNSKGVVEVSGFEVLEKDL